MAKYILKWNKGALSNEEINFLGEWFNSLEDSKNPINKRVFNVVEFEREINGFKLVVETGKDFEIKKVGK